MPRVVLPIPPNELRVNATGGQHWGKVWPAKMVYRLKAWPKIDEQRSAWEGVPVVWPVHLYLTVYLDKKQRCDLSDAGTWCKYPLDLLVEAGAFPDDGTAYIRPFTTDVRRDWKDPRIEFRWAEAESALAAALAEPGSRMVKVRRKAG